MFAQGTDSSLRPQPVLSWMGCASQTVLIVLATAAALVLTLVLIGVAMTL